MFTPAFGAFVHMKNWQALGQPDKAASARNWVIVSVLALAGLSLLAALLPPSSLLADSPRSLGFVLLIAWYFGSARGQARHVKERFGTDYPRRGWGMPILLASAAIVVFLVGVFAVAFGASFARRV